MKKLYISADIEGVCGVVDWAETDIGEAQGAYARAQMTREVRAACDAALEAGVKEILVKDSHGSGRSIDPTGLPEEARLLRAWTRDPLVMMAGLDPSYEAAVFIGYHSAAGEDGNPLAHTMNGNLARVEVNGRTASEFLMNAFTAARLGVPCLFLSGDRMLCENAPAIAPGIRSFAVSEGSGNASISVNPALAVRRIKEGVAEAIKAASSLKPIELAKEFEVKVDFKQHYLANRGSYYPGAEKIGPYSVAYRAKDWMDVLRFFFFVL